VGSSCMRADGPDRDDSACVHMCVYADRAGVPSTSPAAPQQQSHMAAAVYTGKPPTNTPPINPIPYSLASLHVPQCVPEGVMTTGYLMVSCLLRFSLAEPCRLAPEPAAEAAFRRGD